MTTRRDILKGGAGLAAILASGKAPAYIVKSMLASRIGIGIPRGGAKVPTASDYVQDGLVAMWDGIENAGWGVHDESATTWVDLAGSNSLSLTGISAFTSNSLNCPTSSTYSATGSVISQTIGQIEIVLNVATPYADSINRLVVSFGEAMRPGLSLQRSNGLLFKGRESSYVFDFGFKKFSASYNETSCHVNGSEITQRGAFDTWSNFGSGVFLGNYTTGARPFVGDIYTIRLYSRALSAEEIAANYAVDKQRFNLP